MNQVLHAWPSWLRGAEVTLEVTAYGTLLALVLSLVFGVLSTLSGLVPRTIARIFIELFRGIAALVLMYWLYYSLPTVGLKLHEIAAGAIALGLNVGAYGAEAVRGAILAVPREQYEATVALNFTTWQRLRLVILPQAWAAMLPPFGNLLIQLLKASALVSLIGLTDLTQVAQNLRGFTGKALPPFVVALVAYFVIAQLLLLVVRYLERRSNIRLGRRPESARRERESALGRPAEG